jgi:hypothetical protein
VGPLALPLVWLNPRYKLMTKVVVTVLVVALTVLFCYLAARLYLALTEQMGLLAGR